MLEVVGLTVAYRGFSFGPVDYTIGDGEFLSLIGTNGSGKSTMIRSLLGLNDHVTGGTVTYDGCPTFARPAEVFSSIGYVSDSSEDVLSEFTAEEYWQYCRLAYERAGSSTTTDHARLISRYATMLDFPLGLRRPLSALSLGTARKAQIIAALVSEPSLLILDEPFIGLDFIAARALEDLLATLRNNGTAILASSHDLDLASRLADKLLVLHAGKVVLNEEISTIGGPSMMEARVRKSLLDARGR